MTSPPIPILLMAQELAQGGSERQLTEVVTTLDRKLFKPHVAQFRPAENSPALGHEVMFLGPMDWEANVDGCDEIFLREYLATSSLRRP